jgi:hypothetical protein
LALFFDERSDDPGVHALIVGVSDYPFLKPPGKKPHEAAYGMSKLSACAASAMRLADWLVANREKLINRFGQRVPLASIRILATPTAEEKQRDPRLASVEAATLRNFRVATAAWREDARLSKESVTWFYFAGHGVQRSLGDAVLLLEEFGDGIGGVLASGAAVADIRNAMSPDQDKRKKIARTQYWFIDACNTFPKEFAKLQQVRVASVFDEDIPSGTDDRMAPIYFAALSGAKAYAVRDQHTIFNQALLSCLEGGGGDNREIDGREQWCITSGTLDDRLHAYIDELNARHGADQEARIEAPGRDTVMAYLDGPPPVEVRIEIEPPAALQVTRIALIDDYDATPLPLTKPLSPHPFIGKVSAGYYRVGGTIEPPTSPYQDRPLKTCRIEPPRTRLTIPVVKR